jgi:hypothetical protein
LLTCYSPVRRSSTPKGAFPLDLHVLSTPPAFVLSQDQTLQQKLSKNKPRQNTKNGAAKKQSPKTGTKQTWHWLIKHPVEFSKNNHTPQHNQQQAMPRGNHTNLPGRFRGVKPCYSAFSRTARILPFRRADGCPWSIVGGFCRTGRLPAVRIVRPAPCRPYYTTRSVSRSQIPATPVTAPPGVQPREPSAPIRGAHVPAGHGRIGSPSGRFVRVSRGRETAMCVQGIASDRPRTFPSSARLRASRR